MKIEKQETSIRLLPENEWEREALKDLRKKGAEKIEFQDDWDRKGYQS